MSKPLTEVMAAVFYDELMRLKQNRFGGGPLGSFYKLPGEDQADMLSAMAEVTRMFEMFGWVVGLDPKGNPVLAHEVLVEGDKAEEDGLGERQYTDSDQTRPTDLSTPRVDHDTAKQQGYSGEACIRCGSYRTIRNGTCITCLDCHHSGECG